MDHRPTSPTSMLWAHQLKKEHKFLLDRMKALEEASKDFENRFKVVAAENKGLKEVLQKYKDLAKKVNTLEEEQKDVVRLADEIRELERARAKEEEVKFKTLTRKIGLLEEHDKKNTAKCATLSKQVQGLDTSKRDDEKKRMTLQKEIDALRAACENECSDMAHVASEISRLGSVCNEANDRTRDLATQVQELSRALAKGTPRKNQVIDIEDTSARKPFDPLCPLKSHPLRPFQVHRDRNEMDLSQATTLTQSALECSANVDAPAAEEVQRSGIQVQKPVLEPHQTRSMASQKQRANQKRRRTSSPKALQPVSGNRVAAQAPARPARKKRQIIQLISDEELEQMLIR